MGDFPKKRIDFYYEQFPIGNNLVNSNLVSSKLVEIVANGKSLGTRMWGIELYRKQFYTPVLREIERKYEIHFYINGKEQIREKKEDLELDTDGWDFRDVA